MYHWAEKALYLTSAVQRYTTSKEFPVLFYRSPWISRHVKRIAYYREVAVEMLRPFSKGEDASTKLPVKGGFEP